MRKIGFLILSLMVMFTTGAYAFDIGQVIGAVAGGVIVDATAKPLDDALNKLTFNKTGRLKGYTKVVPILSMGSGTHIGAAQVTGLSKASVESCKAVAQLEVEVMGTVRAKVLVPIDRTNVTTGFKRVQGVGVSAIVDVKL